MLLSKSLRLSGIRLSASSPSQTLHCDGNQNSVVMVSLFAPHGRAMLARNVLSNCNHTIGTFEIYNLSLCLVPFCDNLGMLER